MKEKSERKILVLYTGGTIGMHREAEKGPLKPGTAEDLQKNIPELEDLPYNIEWQEFRKDGEFIDSSNADVEYYNQLAKELGKAQEKYDGIVVVFGTDTMAPSAGSISYMLEGLKKPIVFTGSMIPAIDEGSDGPKNLIDAIHVAAKSGNEIPAINEVTICFHGKLERGVKARKYSASDVDAFDTEDGTPPLATIDENGDIEVKADMLLTPPSEDSELKINELKINKETEIGPLNIYSPWPEPYENFVNKFSNCKALLLFGGRFYNDPRQQAVEQYAKPDQIIIYAHENPPNPKWIELKGIGDFQQAMAKIKYVLSRTTDPDEVRALLEGNLRGENDEPRRFETEILREIQKETFEPSRLDRGRMK